MVLNAYTKQYTLIYVACTNRRFYEDFKCSTRFYRLIIPSDTVARCCNNKDDDDDDDNDDKVSNDADDEIDGSSNDSDSINASSIIINR